MTSHHYVMNQCRMELYDLLFLVGEQFGHFVDLSNFSVDVAWHTLNHHIKLRLSWNYLSVMHRRKTVAT